MTGTKPGNSSMEWGVTSMQRKLVQGMKITPLGHLDERMEPGPI